MTDTAPTTEQGNISEFKKNLPLLFDALEAVIPIFLKSGGTVRVYDAYDDWEDIIDRMFRAFIVHAVTDSGDFGPMNEFHTMGAWKIERDSRARIFFATFEDEEYFLNDINSEDGKTVAADWDRFVDEDSDARKSVRSRDLRGFSGIRLGVLSSHSTEDSDTKDKQR